MSIYSSAEAGCIHKILLTAKIKDSQSNYEHFTRALCSIIPKSQWKRLESEFFFFVNITYILIVLTSVVKMKVSVSGMGDVPRCE